MKLRQICLDCIGRYECEKSDEKNWKSCRGKSYFKQNKKLFNILIKNSKEVKGINMTNTNNKEQKETFDDVFFKLCRKYHGLYTYDYQMIVEEFTAYCRNKNKME